MAGFRWQIDHRFESQRDRLVSQSIEGVHVSTHLRGRVLAPTLVLVAALCLMSDVAAAATGANRSGSVRRDVNALVTRFQADLRLVSDPALALRGSSVTVCPQSMGSQLCEQLMKTGGIVAARARDHIPPKSRGARVLRHMLHQASVLAKKLRDAIHSGRVNVGSAMEGVPDGVKGCLWGALGTIASELQAHQAISIPAIIAGCVHGYLEAKARNPLPPFSALRSPTANRFSAVTA
jgi:hypothetical protein